MSAAIRISVIVPSLADAPRAKLLDRAIASALAQEGVVAVPIIVVNGGRHDPAVLDALRRRTDVRLEYFSHGGLSEARQRGRELVDTPFFAYLDDDDELLPHSLRTRLQPLLADEAIDVVISNGIRETPAGRVITDPHIDRFQADPLEGLIETNWLNESGGLYRTRSVGTEFFTNLPAVVEWTYIAFQLAQSRKIRFIDVQTFLKHDTEGSLSKSKNYHMQHPYVVRDILRLPLPDLIRSKLRRKYIGALHQSSEAMLEHGDLASAWRFHLQSLCDRNGLRYLGYTRHILRRQLQRRFGRGPG